MAKNIAGGYKAAAPSGGYYGSDPKRSHWTLPLFQAGVAAYRKARAHPWTVQAFAGGTPIPHSQLVPSNKANRNPGITTVVSDKPKGMYCDFCGVRTFLKRRTTGRPVCSSCNETRGNLETNAS